MLMEQLEVKTYISHFKTPIGEVLLASKHNKLVVFGLQNRNIILETAVNLDN